jgi:hypothetical protein
MGKPSLAYSGQSSKDLIAHQKTHRLDSILFCLAAAITEKAKRALPLSPAEHVVQSVVSMHRAVWEVGFGAYFRDSGQSGAKSIAATLADLETAGAEEAAEIARQAFAVRRRPAAIEAFDEAYFQETATEKRLWQYVLDHRAAIEVPAFADLPAATQFPDSAMQKLWWALEDAPYKPKESVDQCVLRAAKLVGQKKISASEVDIEGAVLWFLLAHWVEEERLDDCASIGERALLLAGKELASEVQSWTEQLIENGDDAEADRWASAFLRQFAADPSPAPMDVEMWADFLEEHRHRLPLAAKVWGSRTK